MLNIISKSFYCPHPTGPNKVIKNLIKGLDKIKYPYVINKDPLFGEFIYINDDVVALKYLQKNKPEFKAIIGPNIIIPPNEKIDYTNLVLVQPSEWTKKFCIKYRFNKSPIEAWPIGIDTDTFVPSNNMKDKVLIYFKNRFKFELSAVICALEKREIKYSLIEYGEYREVDYQEALKRAKYIIWIGRQESQGIAMGDALASNIPMIVLDVPRLGHWVPSTEKEKIMFTQKELDFTGVTSAPFFDDRCGFKVLSFEEVEKKINEMEKKYLSFKSRKYILENLSLEGQAQALLDIFKKYNFNNKYHDQFKNTSVKNWRNALLWENLYRAKYFFKFLKRK